MKRKRTNRILAVMLAVCMLVTGIPFTAFAAPSDTADVTAENVSKVMSYTSQIRKANRIDDYSQGHLTWDTEGKSDNWRYFNGVMLDAILMAGGEENVNFAIEFYNDNINQDGSAKNYHPNEVDSVPVALGLFDLLDTNYSEKYEKTIQYVYDQLQKQPVLGAEYGYNYWHKSQSDSWSTWKFGLDGLYMADTFLMEYANALDEGKLNNTNVKSADLYKDVYQRFVWVADTMLDETTGLYHHGWNGSNGNGQFWGRGIGWYAVALVDTIEMMPKGEYKNILISKLPKLFDGMINYQDNATGMWYNVVNRDSSLTAKKGNKLETSVSAMMSYALMKAYNNGWVDAGYGTAGLSAFNGTIQNKMSGTDGAYTVKDIYQKSGVGTTEDYYCTNSYVSDEAKGTAALIMAATIANETASKLALETQNPEVAPTPEVTPTPEATPTPDVTPVPEITPTPEAVQEETVVVDGVEITVENVTNLSGTALTEQDRVLMEEKGYADVWGYDLSAELAEGETAVVGIPVPEQWNVTSSDQVIGLSVEEGELKQIKGTMENGVFSFEVSHFSGKGIARVGAVGSLSAGKNYQLVTGELDTTGKYIIVANVGGKYYALSLDKTDNDKITTKAVELTVSENGAAFVLEDDSQMAMTLSGTSGQISITHTSSDYTKGTLEVGGDVKFKTNEPKNVYLVEGEDNQFAIYKEYKDNIYKKALTCNPAANETKKQWTESDSASYVYLYKYAGDSEAETVTFSVEPETVHLCLEETQVLTPTIVLGDGTVVTSSSIIWSSSDSEIATVENGVIHAVAEGNATITAKLTNVNGKAVAGGGITIQIPVEAAIKKMHAEISPVLSGNSSVTTDLGVQPDFSNIKLKVTYEDNSTADMDVNSGVTITGYDRDTVGKYLADITYKGVTYGKVLVIVEGNPYAGLEQAEEPYPVYPQGGAVRVKKTASPSANFQSTGVARVELDVAGISVKQGVDVVLVVDVSNSMAWTDHWFKNMTDEQVASAKDKDKIPEGYDVTQTDKLDQAMAAATEFANTLLEDNVEGSSDNNSISFVTFAGNDQQLGGSKDNIDSVQTVFTNIQDASKAAASFSNTKFTKLAKNGDNGSVTYTLQIGYTDGQKAEAVNRGNTNYDYAFAEAKKAVEALQGSYPNYEETGRETIVVFMTDGAPSHYNNDRTNGTAEDLLANDNKQEYPRNNGKYSEDQWLEKINEYNMYAADLEPLCEDIYAIGFDLDHGGFNDYSWTEEELRPVLAGIISNTKDIETMLAQDGVQLHEFYKSLAKSIKMAGENAKVQDIIADEFTLQMKSTVTAANGELTLEQAPSIEVVAYDLVQKGDAGATLETIGDRKGTSDVLERVTFKKDGTAAYSNVLGENVNIMTCNEDGSEVTIEAFYFTYTKVNGVETFDWNIGKITDKEIALAFDVRLEGGAMGEREEGLYYTNEEAVLEYIDVHGDYAKQVFPVPALAWGGIAIAYEFYLVDEDGNPVSRDMQTIIPISNRITVWGPGYQKFNQNEDGSITATIEAQKALPAGYVLYDENASYTVTFNVRDGVLVPESVPSGSATYEVTNVLNGTPHVAFAVTTYPENKDYSLHKDEIVMDYGKPILIDVLANDEGVAEEYTKTIVGYAAYNSLTDQKVFLTEFNESENQTFIADEGNGCYTIQDQKVLFTPTHLLSMVDKVFAVVKFVKNNNKNDVFYMYNELNIVPATNVYYETDFASEVFAYSNVVTTDEGTKQVDKWSDKTDTIAADGPQDDGTIGLDQTYGFDTSYQDDAVYSNHHSYFVEGQGLANTTAAFAFKGTGFDLISRTGADQGAIRVDIYSDDGRSKLVKSVTVLNKSESNLELSQIPVVSVHNLAYGNYYVTVGVNAAYTNTTGIAALDSLNRGGEFYFDAIRVYEPVKGNRQAENAYAKDNEASPELYEVRDMLIAAGDADILNEGVQGISYIDRTEDKEEIAIADYAVIGPNNEVYLAKDAAIAFKVTWTGDAPASIDIGAKTIGTDTVDNSLPAHMKAYISASAEGDNCVVDTEVSSATVEFYELVNKENAALFGNSKSAYVVVENTGDYVLSITDIKVAYSTVSAVSEIDFAVDEPVLMYARACFRMADEPEYSEPEAEPNYDILSAVLENTQVKRNRSVKLTVETTEDVDAIQVDIANTKTAGPGAKKAKAVPKEQDTADLKSVEIIDGIKLWVYEVRIATNGDKALTITGYGEDGTSGLPATVNLKVKP